ncbi:hypothetical protein NK8_12470 [Caballeronia sp. NK8]|uniref:hypothetical protein n=1 Tax=Caballeronia sp. NK8 TaxID=140098 RepID=UPI001BB69E79|nr:hypothetical protein [Caballeronia sp. NK8]BCQ23122.1 hypothetical protein NK8_12470 [Caballeronia sp. NK8]
MNAYQIVVLLFAVTMVAAIALVRGADLRAKRRHFDDIEQRKKRIRWPAAH